jgi:PTH2 family peptidyl-tRNA hydrolase
MKQVIVVRKDLKLSRGKLAAQVAHASFSSSQLASRRAVKTWERDGQKKVVLAAGKQHIMEIKKKCRKLRIPHSLISDAGLTELPSGTVTCLGIGPADDSKIDKLTGSLPLLK